MTKFHAHVFFDADDSSSVTGARRIWRDLPEGATPSGWLERPGGPLPEPRFQVDVDSSRLGILTEWLMHHRADHVVLLHPDTGDDVKDHTQRAVWFGGPLELRLDKL